MTAGFSEVTLFFGKGISVNIRSSLWVVVFALIGYVSPMDTLPHILVNHYPLFYFPLTNI